MRCRKKKKKKPCRRWNFNGGGEGAVAAAAAAEPAECHVIGRLEGANEGVRVFVGVRRAPPWGRGAFLAGMAGSG